MNNVSGETERAKVQARLFIANVCLWKFPVAANQALDGGSSWPHRAGRADSA